MKNNLKINRKSTHIFIDISEASKLLGYSPTKNIISDNAYIISWRFIDLKKT